MLYKYYDKLGWPIIILLSILPIIVWILSIDLQAKISSSAMLASSLGRITGIIAVVLFCLNLILSTRLKGLENLFGGLNKMYIAHHITGGISLCILLAHPVALAASYVGGSMYEAARFLLPTLDDIPKLYGTLALWIFVGLMVLTFYIKLPYNIWLLSHKFMGVVLGLMFLHVLYIGGDNREIPFLRWYLLILLFFATVSFVYRTLLPRFFVRRYIYTINEVQNPIDNVVRLILKPKEEGIDFKSGQFVFIRCNAEGVSKEWHPFTISSNSKDEGLAITLKGLGKYTNTLVQLAPSMVGMEIEVEGAYGRFNFRNFKAKKQIWIAGGIGVTPFLSMLREVGPEYQIDFYYSVKTKAEIIDWQNIIERVATAHGNIKFYPIIADQNGLLTYDKIRQNSGDISGADILICGPPPMMHALREQMMQSGIKKSNIHSEEFAIT